MGSQVFGASVPRLGGSIGYDWANNTLFMLAIGPGDEADNLYSLNTSTGVPTLIGPTGLSGVHFVGLADSPVPEPASAALIGIGLLGLVVAKKLYLIRN